MLDSGIGETKLEGEECKDTRGRPIDMYLNIEVRGRASISDQILKSELASLLVDGIR